MIEYLKSILKFFSKPTQSRRSRAEEEYLARSKDLVDLERRQRNLMNGNVDIL